jgi:protein O-mannosyl-transferase
VLLALIAALVYFPVVSQEVGNHDEIEWIRSVEPPTLETAKLIVTWDTSRFFKIGYYAPLTALSIMVDLRIGDMLGNRDAVLKGTNLSLHILDTLLVFALIRVMGFGPWLAFAVAAVFCVHPLQVSSVAWLAERKNLLMAACFLAALLCYHEYRRRGGLHWFVAVLVLYVLALAAKPSAVALGPCILIADWFLIDRKFTVKSALRIAPMIVIGLLWTVAAVATERSGGSPPPLFERLLMVPYKIGFMLSKFLVPIDLTHIYPPVSVDVASFLWWGATLVFIAVAAIVLTMHRASPIWIVLWGVSFYLLNLVPSLGIVPFSGMKELYVADHYQYLSIIAASLLVALGVDYLLKEAGARNALAAKRALLCATVLVLGLLSSQHLKIWTNAESLWTQVISYNPKSLTAHYNYGHYLDDHGRYREAVIQYERALAINDQAYRPYNNLGLIMMRFGKIDPATAYFRKCAELNPLFGDPHLSLAKISFSQEKYEQALEHCRKAAELGAECNPDELKKAALEKSKERNQ